MNIPTYDVNAKAEGGWIAVGTAAGALVGAILVALDVDANIVATASPLVAGLVRLIIGRLLPSSAT